MSSDLRMIRHAVVRPGSKPLPIWSGDPPRPIDARWLAILRSTECSHRPVYILEFVDENGAGLEWLQFETARIALDQAHALAGATADDWIACNRVVPEDDRLPLEWFEGG
jgi:hypothetical protein